MQQLINIENEPNITHNLLKTNYLRLLISIFLMRRSLDLITRPYVFDSEALHLLDILTGSHL